MVQDALADPHRKVFKGKKGDLSGYSHAPNVAILFAFD